MTRPLLSAILCLLLAVPAAAQSHFAPMIRMGQLAGDWVGTVTNTKRAGSDKPLPVHLHYDAVSAGNAVVETLKMGEFPGMVSVYYQEGDQLMMTHFCTSNTQPRLRTRSIPRDMKEFVFVFVDSTNILNANWMNIVSLKLEFPTKDDIVQSWQSHDRAEGATVVTVHRASK